MRTPCQSSLGTKSDAVAQEMSLSDLRANSGGFTRVLYHRIMWLRNGRLFNNVLSVGFFRILI